LSYLLVREEVWGIDLIEDVFRVIQSIIFGGIALWSVVTAISASAVLIPVRADAENCPLGE
jgi:hypothetical protein